MNTMLAVETDKQPRGIARTSWVLVAISLSYLGLIVNGMMFRHFIEAPLNNTAVIARELINLAMVGLIAWIVLRIERRPLESIGLHSRHWVKSLGWSFIQFVVCFGTAILIMLLLQAFGVTYGDEKAFAGLSLWTVTLVVLRAGVAEEFMMRGYLLQRIEEWTGSTWIAVILTLIPFALLHLPQGPAGVLISFVLGGILTAFYVWKRDLKANMAGHFLVDFVANVGLPFLG